ncbi:MAG: iron-sulfur cluster assembly protein [Alphaproteobacteria bacterium]|nr:iron-sulfur cluster assembly protein [Alphaproteobacteria bacterium]
MTALDHDRKVAEVWSSLASVTDPELDESVTELGFVTTVTVDQDDGVNIGFRLPTYWCAANFAFLMADDMRRAALDLPWVASVNVGLQDHVYADKINRGMATGQSFMDTFAGEAEGDLDEVRQTFRRKAFQRRQEAVIRDLLGRGWTAEAVIGMPLSALEQLPIDDDEGRRLLARYLELRHGWDNDAAAVDRAFVTAAGLALEAGTFDDYLKELRRVRLNVELNGVLCRGLLKARYREKDSDDEEPTLLDFALGQVK